MVLNCCLKVVEMLSKDKSCKVFAGNSHVIQAWFPPISANPALHLPLHASNLEWVLLPVWQPGHWTLCQLFGETVEENFQTPADVPSDELLGLEYLFSQSTGESGTFSLEGLVDDGPGPEEEVVQPGQPDPDEAYQSDGEAQDDVRDAALSHITLTSDETSTVYPPAFEDACSPNPLPGFQKLEKFCSVLVEIGLIVYKLSLSTEQRNRALEAWNAMEEHDKHPQQFNQLYQAHWGNSLYCRTKRDDPFEAAVVQRVKMAKRYAPAQHDISAQHNRLMYTLVKLLWLHSPQGSCISPEKAFLLKAYEQIQHRILVEDPVLCKAGIPLPKINMKTVRDFIRRQERLLNMRATKQPLTITKTTSISSVDLPPAPHQPVTAGPSTRPIMPASESAPVTVGLPTCAHDARFGDQAQATALAVLQPGRELRSTSVN